MSAWTALILRPAVVGADPGRSPAWNRGAYLVESLGHCGACHTARNALGAEKTGAARLAGGLVDGWDAPSLTATSKAPVPWTQQALFDYLRTGRSVHHSAAAGPMAHVIDALAPLPDSDIHAMATYLASFNPTAAHLDKGQEAVLAGQLEAQSVAAHTAAAMTYPIGARVFAGACAGCHEGADLPSLVLNANIHADRADNVIRSVIDGVSLPEHQGVAGGGRKIAPSLSVMPSFSTSLSDDQIAALVGYLRQRFAPGKPAWINVGGTITTIRQSLDHP